MNWACSNPGPIAARALSEENDRGASCRSHSFRHERPRSVSILQLMPGNIDPAFTLYVQCELSLRNVGNLLHGRGVDICHCADSLRAYLPLPSIVPIAAFRPFLPLQFLIQPAKSNLNPTLFVPSRPPHPAPPRAGAKLRYVILAPMARQNDPDVFLGRAQLARRAPSVLYNLPSNAFDVMGFLLILNSIWVSDSCQ